MRKLFFCISLLLPWLILAAEKPKPKDKKVKVYYEQPPVWHLKANALTGQTMEIEAMNLVTFSGPEEKVNTWQAGPTDGFEDAIPYQTIFLTDDDIKAFITAKGFGQNATGGRGGTIYHVTNLNDSGPGSLRNGVEQSGARIIVFDIAGDINLNDMIFQGGSQSAGQSVSEAEENLTILGQTAPGPGITITGGGFLMRSSNTIIRYISARPNDPSNSSAKPFRIRNVHVGYNMQNIVLDHVTASHATDENISVGAQNGTLSNVTIQNSMAHKALVATNNYNSIVGESTTNLSWIENYLSHARDRSPFIGYADLTVEVINNIIYCFNEGTHVVFGADADLIYNIWKDAPTDPATGEWIKHYENRDNAAGKTAADSEFYNLGPIYLNGPEQVDPAVISNNRSSRAITNSLVDTWFTNQADIEGILTNVGNNLYQDSLDANPIADYSAETGDWSTDATIPSKTSNTHPAGYDTDNDGLSQAWETLQGGDVGPNDRSATFVLTDGRIVDQSGVTNYATQGYTQLDVFTMDLAGDWDEFAGTAPAASCNDGIQNGDETGVDCGGACPPCTTSSSNSSLHSRRRY